MSSAVKIAPMEQSATKPSSTGMSFMTKVRQNLFISNRSEENHSLSYLTDKISHSKSIQAFIGIGILAVLGGIVAIVLVVIDDGDGSAHTHEYVCIVRELNSYSSNTIIYKTGTSS